MPPKNADEARQLTTEMRLTFEEKSAYMHPLELLGFFRRWPRSLLRDILYTCIFNTSIGTFFLLISLTYVDYRSAQRFFEVAANNLVVANIIGFTFHIVYSFLGPLLRRINRLPFWGIVASYTLMGTVIVQVGFYVTSMLPGFGNIRNWIGGPQWILSTMVISFIISLIITIAWQARVNALVREAQVARENERLEAAERAAAQASLRALQAQIEPHFLFNTLANVVGLIHPHPDKAKLMLEQFIAYLRATLAETREESTTLAREFQLMRNFLAVLQIRMGERLQVAFELPPALAEVPLPPMLLQPLVENAIKHGLEPKVDGGSVTLSARRENDTVRIAVADTGLGFTGATSSGIGLKNVRERIDQIYDGAGRLDIEENPEGGTRVIVTIPMRRDEAEIKH